MPSSQRQRHDFSPDVMRNLSTTIATYPDRTSAEKDWHAIEDSAKAETIDMADAALVVCDSDGGVTTVEGRQAGATLDSHR